MAAILTPGFLFWDGFKYILKPGTFTPAGDLSGDAISQTVVGIDNHPVPAPTGTGTVLTWSGSTFSWGSASGFTAGGDLSGSSTNQTVIGIQAQAVPAPTGTGTVLTWSGSSFSWGAGGSGITQLTGDVAAGPGSGSVASTLVSISGASPIHITPVEFLWAGNAQLNAADSTSSTVNASSITINGGSNTAVQAGSDSGAGADVNINGGTTRQVGGGGGDVNISGGRNLGSGGGGGAFPGILAIPGGYANGEDIIFTMPTDGDGNSKGLVVNDHFGDTWFTVASAGLLGGGASANAINMSPQGVLTASVIIDQFVFNAGWRRNIRSISSGSTVNLAVGNDYVAITTLSAPFQINLPSNPTTGDTYEIKDTVGAAGSNNVTVSGNGKNIDGASTFVMSTNFQHAVFTYTSTQWSIS